MRKWSLVLLILFVLSTVSVFAGGRKDNESHTASDPAGFTESINVEEKKTGKWNFYMEAEDKGGNTTIAGPHNIYIDPESDLPIARVINPMSNMRVQGNLNIVGTCIDDDGVAYVDLVITRGADGKGEVLLEARAEGADFWSYFVDTTNAEIWRDGVYSITAWGTDINGLSGISSDFPVKSHKKDIVTWNLDRNKPDITVSSHALGALVSGKVNIRGTVWDGNGIDSFAYSLDGGDRYYAAALKYDSKTDIYSYDIPLDTKTLEDGATVLQFRAKDKMRTEGYLSHLVLVNNTGPDVQILYPEADAVVNGLFTVAGSAIHRVGLSSLSWKIGKEGGDIPLITGNPWWSQEIDIRGQNLKSVDLEIQAVDISGNATTTRRRINVDQDADVPRVVLEEPVAGTVLSPAGMYLVGTATDNEGVAAIIYSIAGKPPVEVPCSGYFSILVDDVPGGTHTLEVWAKDITGVEGPKVSVRGVIAPERPPELSFIQARSGARGMPPETFYSGIEVNRDSNSNLDLLISSGAGMQSLSYQLGSRAPTVVRGIKAGVITQPIAIPRDQELGKTRLLVTYQERADSQAVAYEDYIVVTGVDGRGYEADDFTWVRSRQSGGRIQLSAGETLTGFFSGGPVQSVAPDGEAGSLLFNRDANGIVTVTGAANGSFGPVRLNLTTTGGTSFTTEPFNFIVSSDGPGVEMVQNPDGAWVQSQLQLEFRVNHNLNIRAVEYSTNLGQEWRPLLQSNELGQLSSSAALGTINLSTLPDGLITVFLRVTDEANAQTLRIFRVNKDTVAPQVAPVVPIVGSKVNGTTLLGFSVKEGGLLASVTYELPERINNDGTVRPAITRQLYPDGDKFVSSFLDVVMDTNTMPLADDMSLVFADAAGNKTTVARWPFIIDQESDLPVVQVSLPAEEDVISTDFVITGVCFDDDEVKGIWWCLDDGREQFFECLYGFAIDVPLAAMTDNEHSVTVYAEDIFGVKGKPVTVNFMVSLKEPVASIVSPTEKEFVGGLVTVAGEASDANGIKGIQVSLDNGNSYNNGDGAEEWSYTFDSEVLPDGNHAVFIRVWDNCDIMSVYSCLINVDNSAPELTIDTPSDGMETTGPIYITGTVMDNMLLDSLVVRVNSIDMIEVPEQIAEKVLKLETVILEGLNLSSLPDGSYNVEVWATDMAKNVSRVSRNVVLNKEGQRNFVKVLFPLNGQYMQGYFNIYGSVGGIDTATEVTLMVNDFPAYTEEVSEAGYYRFALGPADLRPGRNRLQVRSNFGGRENVVSDERIIEYRANGPWVTIDTMNMGDFAYSRPWLMGRAGYELTEEEQTILADKKIDKLSKIDIEEKKVALIELSFNNGRSFFTAGKAREKGFDWRYRLETGEMPEGLHYLVVRATMVNGDRAVSRLLIQVDKTPPMIRVISPEAGGHYNEEIEFAALANDDVELKDLTYYLRKGDKAFYGVPGFIKGLYFDVTIPPIVKQVWNNAPLFFAGGPTYIDVGFGLSFFDDNVKLQASWGIMTQALYESIGGSAPLRYGGHVLGIKILANIYSLPFGTIAGPDWEWLSAALAVGANFSLFDLLKEGYTQSGNRTWMAAMLAQLEFPKVTIPNRKYFRTFSFYTEGQIWFVPTDVDAKANNIKTVIPHAILGLRAYVF